MLETDNMLRLNVLVMGLPILWMDFWYWDINRVIRVERAWLETLSAMKILSLFTYFLFFSYYLSVGGLFNFWAGLESVRLSHVYTISSVESSSCKVGTNKCYCGVGWGMGWNRYSLGLLDIPRNMLQLWSCWWAAIYGVKCGLPPKFRPLLFVSLDSHSPISGWIFWPNNLVRMGPEGPTGGWCWAVQFVAEIEGPRLGPRGVTLSRPSSGDSPRVLVRLHFHPFLFKWGVDNIQHVGWKCGLGACSETHLSFVRGNAPIWM
ncbi:hypothetical protein L1987_84586 [Smallanthus sonchifolius]|uniref:Uncharacterized protein n=1 Tax=Smallanthus sonchifolius TaxID=185202 RepID=A0ACB8XV81_9ASTR|nr:hypothetical protein L1987_84586 [Smallanthus sonchifolius]